MHPDDAAATLAPSRARKDPGHPAPAPGDPPDGEPEGGELDGAPPLRGASDSQLLRLGRLLGLSYQEAEALLEVLAETPPPRASPSQVERGLRERLAAFSPQLFAALQAVPGLFLLTDGVTPARLMRARDRAASSLAAARRLGRLMAWAEAAAGREVELLGRAGAALTEGLRSGRLGEATALLRELLRPLRAPRRRGAKGVVH